MTETTDVNTTADADGCATGGVCCFTAYAHRHATYTDLYVHARIYPGDANDVGAGRSRPAQGESAVEVDRVYLIAYKSLDLMPSYPEPSSRSLRRNPPEPGDSSTLYGHGRGRNIGMICLSIRDVERGEEKLTEIGKPSSSLSSRL